MSLVVMLRRARRLALNFLRWGAALLTLVTVSGFGVLVWAVASLIKDTIASQTKLRSLITENTPISGFYGPGSWWALLITLGMMHAHMGVSFLVSAELPEEWDYDLIGASGYVTAAAIDLTLKARKISKLGDDACKSPLLPALLCAERAVSVGTGSSLFTIAMASYVGGFSGRHRIGIAILPVLFAVIASGFTFKAHQAIFRTDPEIPCKLPDGSQLKPELSFVLVDVLEILVVILTTVFEICMSRFYWLVAGAITIIAAVLNILIRDKLPWSTLFGLALVGVALLPLTQVVITVGLLFEWFFLWVIFWVLLYVMAFFPQLGSFSLTGMSVMDMDQLAALLGIGFIAALRSGRRIYKIAHARDIWRSILARARPMGQNLNPIPV